MRKRIIAGILTATMLLILIPDTAMAARMEGTSFSLREAAKKTEIQKPANVSPDMEGVGTEADPYRIHNAEQLLFFANRVNGIDGAPDTALCAELTGDIDLTGVCGADIGSWKPIGTAANPYTGIFDGGFFAINGLYYHKPQSSYVGLFGCNAGTIKNLGIADADITAGNYTGGVCGSNNGIITCCYNTGAVCGGKYVGGVCGYNKNTTVNCYNMGSVNGKSTSIGGVCGYNKTLVSNCFNTGTVNGRGKNYIGSVCGYNHSKSSFLNCYYLVTDRENENYGVAMTPERFASGEVCWLLNDGKSENVVWHQTCGAGFPTFSGKVVYQIRQRKAGGRADEFIFAYTNEKGQKQAVSDSADHAADNNSGTDTDGHVYQEPEWEWIQYQSAKAIFVCRDCGEQLILEASISKETTNATCAADGKTVYTASVDRDGSTYEDSKTVPIPKTGHQTFVPVTVKAATCLEPGISQNCFTCPACGNYFKDQQGTVEIPKTQVVISALGHKYSETPVWNWANDNSSVAASFQCIHGCGETATSNGAIRIQTTASCTKPGTTTYTATANFKGKAYTTSKTVEGEKLPHVFSGKPIKWDWKWDEDYYSATATFQCANGCGELLLEEGDIEQLETTATCTKKGKTVCVATVINDEKKYTDRKTFTDEKLPHDYSEGPDWKWAKDYSSATAGFQCSMCHTPKNLKAAISKTETEGISCSSPGEIVYTATVTFNEEEYTDKQTIAGKTIPHDYSKGPKWKWADDCSSAAATFTCANGCGETVTESGEISETTTTATCTKAGTTTYTATVTMDNKQYKDQKTIDVEKLPHDYGEGPEWEWAADYSAATANFQCTRCHNTGSAKDENPQSESSESTCTSPGKIVYTATVTFDGEEYTGIKTIEGQKLPHDYSEGPKWNWAEDCSSAAATFTCANGCGETVTKYGEISKTTTPATCTTPGETVSTATVSFENKPYTDTKRVTIPAQHELTHVPAKEAQCEEAGNLEYWNCTACHKLFSDEKATLETTVDAVSIPKEGHDLKLEPGTDNYICARCNKRYTITITADGTKSISSIEEDAASPAAEEESVPDQQSTQEETAAPNENIQNEQEETAAPNENIQNEQDTQSQLEAVSFKQFLNMCNILLSFQKQNIRQLLRLDRAAQTFGTSFASVCTAISATTVSLSRPLQTVPLYLLPPAQPSHQGA